MTKQKAENSKKTVYIYLSIYLSIYQAIYISISVCISISVFLYTFISVSIYLCIALSLHLCILYLSISVSPVSTVSPGITVSIYLCIALSLHLCTLYLCISCISCITVSRQLITCILGLRWQLVTRKDYSSSNRTKTTSKFVKLNVYQSGWILVLTADLDFISTLKGIRPPRPPPLSKRMKTCFQFQVYTHCIQRFFIYQAFNNNFTYRSPISKDVRGFSF